MKTDMLVSIDKPVKAPAARKLSIEVTPRLLDTMKIVFTTMQGFRSSSRQELLQAVKKAGYTDADLNAVLNPFVKMRVLEGVSPSAASPKIKKKLGTIAESQSFDPYDAGKRLVEELQGAEGGSWTGQELKAHFNLTPAALHRQRKEHRIIYWRDARHDFHYPKWQFAPGGALLRGIKEVLAMFQSQDEWRIMRFFLGKRDQLSGLRPLDLLRKGDKAAVQKVEDHAKTHVEENTW